MAVADTLADLSEERRHRSHGRDTLHTNLRAKLRALAARLGAKLATARHAALGHRLEQLTTETPRCGAPPSRACWPDRRARRSCSARRGRLKPAGTPSSHGGLKANQRR